MSNRSLNAVLPASSRVPALCLSGQQLTIGEVHAVASGSRSVTITDDRKVLDRLEAAQALVRKAVDSGRRVYGLTTGFGSMADVEVPADQAEASQANLLAFLACGAGRPLDSRHVRAAMLLRANMLLRGASGVRLEVVERLVAFLNHNATPVVRELGSIGASGDLVPLGAIARAITGQASPCRVSFGGREVDGGEALKELGLKPLELLPKEALAIVNGTSFSAAIGADCLHAARNYLGLAFASHAMMTRALLGYEEPYAAFVHECKPHPGQAWSASMMRRLLGVENGAGSADDAEARPHLQDRYSLRCLPQYMGPLVEGIRRVERVIETEMNSVTDNPLIDSANDRFLQSGNFLGQYVGIAMDDLRRCLGLMAKHLDVQISQLVSPEFNRGLPASLVGNGDSAVNMGLKGLQITGNSIMPTLTYFGNPLVEHYPTHAEQFNQNVNGLSWGAANLTAQSVDLYSHYASVALIFAVQSVDLRARALEGHCDGRTLLGPMVVPLYESVYEIAGCRVGGKSPLIFNDSDQSLELVLADLASAIQGHGAPVEAVSLITESLGELEFAV
ncbi:MAG: aromatic amino acid ammonia-lyase [Verrucomicrobiales bacterium]